MDIISDPKQKFHMPRTAQRQSHGRPKSLWTEGNALDSLGLAWFFQFKFLKPIEPVAGPHYQKTWRNWTMLCFKNAQSINNDNKFSFYFMTMHLHTSWTQITSWPHLISWKALAHLAHCPDLALTDYNIFALMRLALLKQHLSYLNMWTSQSMTDSKQSQELNFDAACRNCYRKRKIIQLTTAITLKNKLGNECFKTHLFFKKITGFICVHLVFESMVRK